MTDKMMKTVIDAADAVVRTVETYAPEPIHQVTAVAVALGRLCEHHGIDIQRATLLALAVSSDHPKPADPLPATPEPKAP